MIELNYELAQKVLDAALAKSKALGLSMNVAVVDAGSNLTAFARQDGAWLGSIDIAMAKARTARYFDMPTEQLGVLAQPGQPLFGIEVTNGGLVTFAGGVPLTIDGRVIGAIGVSGSTVENDQEVALAGQGELSRIPSLTT
ncbi:heme-binding protein [Glutamicibacter sp. NPDC087344]|uniref:GlcG/HbpS family heme-binding protein n=1 Tax=Glutamicibacter sp. NPDC087344 TaxID=3363994 RepID=UPI003818C990